MRQLKFSAAGFQKRLARFCEGAETPVAVQEAVASILEDVRKKGDAALLEYTGKFDRAKLTPGTIKVTAEELKAAPRSISATQRKAIRDAIRCVKEFHKHSIPKPWKDRNPHGALVGEVYYPLDRVGIYVPGGNVPLVSTVVMTVAIAQLAKVPEIAVFTPPQADGSVDPGLLAALNFCKVEEVYRVGGAQAVGAMAYGTASIPAVNKVFGPGNIYVTEAKRQVFGTVGVDLLPGPSEVMIIADSSARADFIASDLLAQAEHGVGGKIYLATTSQKLVDEVSVEIKKQLQTLSHAGFIQEALKEGYLVVLTDNLEQAAEAANYIAPEHIELHVRKNQLNGLVKKVRNAGAIFLGQETPTVLGDFTAGPSHTLPTGRTGRYFSGLKLSDFYRRSSIVQYDARSLKKAAPVVEAFSKLEQLDAHGHSLELRIK